MTSVKALSTSVLKSVAMFSVIFAIMMLWASMPQPAKAATLTTQQIEAVTNLLVSFNVDAKTVMTVKAVLNGTGGGDGWKQGTSTRPEDGDHMKPGFPGNSGCALLQRTLNRGHVGDDVRQLQEFLRKLGFLNATSSTDFFGPATERALQAWQAHEGVVTNGDAQSTGFGAVGPKTRQLIMMRCKDLGDDRGNNGNGNGNGNDDHGNQGGPLGNAGTTTPVCVLRANKNTITPGESVVLSWESRNATYASSVTGEQGPVRGSITLTPTETTTYLKRVYNTTSQAECMTTVTVGTTTPAAQKKVVVVPFVENISRTISLMGSGMAAVMDGYLSLFGMALE
jgi:peptidoglycan hydrolase-like protein with peptidoglycan-binding domain